MRWRVVLSVLVLALPYASATGWSAPPDPQTTGSTSGRAITIQGCLSGGSGVYILTDSKVTSYQLTGDPSKLSGMVGREVVVSGSTSGAISASPSETSSATARSRSYSQTIEVTTVKQISKTCRTTVPH